MNGRWTLALGAALLGLLPSIVNLAALWLWLPPQGGSRTTWWVPTLAPALWTALAALSVTLLHFERAATRPFAIRRLRFGIALLVLQFALAAMLAALWQWVLSSLADARWLASQTLQLRQALEPLLIPVSSATVTLLAVRLARGEPAQGTPAEASGAPGFALSHALALQIGFLWSFAMLWAVAMPMAVRSVEVDAVLALVALSMGVAAVTLALRAVAIRPGALPRLAASLPLALLTGVASSLLAVAIVGKLSRRGIELGPAATVTLTIAASVAVATWLTVWWMKRLARVQHPGPRGRGLHLRESGSNAPSP